MCLRFILLKLNYFSLNINVFKTEDKVSETTTRFNLDFLNYTITNICEKYLELFRSGFSN